MKEDLKPCPFCGADDFITFEYPFQRKPGLRGCYVKCKTCGAPSGNRETVKEAIYAWNTRKDEKQ